MAQNTRAAVFLKPEEVLAEAGIREAMRVVHFGCGPGFFAVPAARFVGPRGKVIAIDLKEQSLEEVGNKARLAGLENIDAVRADITQGGSKLPDGWADMVILTNILHQSDLALVMREAARVLKPGVGKVLAIEWDIVNIPIGPPVDQRVAPDELLAAARLANLTVLRRWKPSSYHYSFLLTRVTNEKK